MFRRTAPYFVPITLALPVFHRTLYRWFGGRGVDSFGGRKMMLLTTKGARSGKKHTVPIPYLEDGRDLVIVGSNWGKPTQPDWYWNVLANPAARVQRRRKRTKVTARVAKGEERERLWDRMVGFYAGYEKYGERTHGIREIPVVVLTPQT